MKNPTFSLVVPLWNEEKNIARLVEMLDASGLAEQGMKEVVLVNNGSKDATGKLIDEFAHKQRWIKPLHLPENLNYGGGVYAGFGHCGEEILAYIPGDLQVAADDLKKVWKAFQSAQRQTPSSTLFIKGHRTIRKDGFNTRFVSKIYTVLSNVILNLKIKDVNGLPKMFHRDLLKLLPSEKMRTFVFDAQLLFAARKNHWTIIEIPVSFHARREGISSWSRKRLATYWQTFQQIQRLKDLV